MKAVRIALGIVWILLAPTSVVLLTIQMIEKIVQAPAGTERLNTSLQWGIILFIFIPVALGLLRFGMYSVQGEYENIEDLEDDA